jgi:hypothetical protein
MLINAVIPVVLFTLTYYNANFGIYVGQPCVG